jgi:squalene-associated FAD-dependent desaturase
VRVVVVGGGFAGLSAAIALNESRHEVTLLERRGILGGRATSYSDTLSGEEVDNGTHLLVGAYRETLDLVRRAGAEDVLLIQENLRIDFVDDKGFSRLDCPPIMAPFHLLAGLLFLRLPWRVRFDAVRFGLACRFGKPPIGITLADYFRKTGQGPAARSLLWDPLATAIVNETPERAAAILFYNVYREAFLQSHDASRLVFLRCGYQVLHERLARYFTNRGGVIHRRALAEGVQIEAGGVTGVRLTQRAVTKGEIRQGASGVSFTLPADVVILAVPWTAVPGLLPKELQEGEPFSALRRLRGSPIVSVDMWLDRIVVELPMVGLRDSEMEWVFDKGRLFGRSGTPQHLSFIVSAAHRSRARTNAELLGAAEDALNRYFPKMRGASIVRSLVMRETDATFASDPEAELLRPGNQTPVRGLFLAGDWTKTGLPATIEGAVRSGRAAARAVGFKEG